MTSRVLPCALAAASGLAMTLSFPLHAQVQWKSAPDQPMVIPAHDNLPTRLLNLGEAGRGVFQLTRPITNSGRELLALLGLTFQAPLGNNAFFGKLAPDANLELLARSGWIKGVVSVDTAWKIDPRLTRPDVLSLWGSRAVENGTREAIERAAGQFAERGASAAAEIDPLVPVYVHLHDDQVTSLETQAIVQQHVESISGALQSVPIFVAHIRQSQIQALASQQIVQYVAPALPETSTMNLQNRQLTGADIANAAPYSLNGSGVSVLVFDAGSVRASHQTFTGRVTVIDGDGMSSHATHCAGTVAGTGAGSSGNQHAGMAPAATVLSAGFGNGSLPSGWLYTNPVDIEADYTNAYNQGADIATNSIGTNVTSNGFPCSWHGDYNATDILIDRMVRGAQSVSQGNPFRIVWAAGNERQSSSCDTATAFPFYHVAPPAGAKNHLSIGAVNANDDSMTSFSSWGPTDDGRMKPDFCAPGCQSNGDTGVTSSTAGSNTEYSSYCGTSMACPTVAGLSALLLQDFRNFYPIAPDPRNSTLKAIFAQTAVDLGNAGPDYTYGYGSVRIVPAIDLLRDGRFDEFDVEQDQIQTFTVTVPEGAARFAATIAWDDWQGTVNTVPELINDIDIVVEGPGGVTYQPWTLNPATPAAPAVQTGANRRDNLEQVSINNPTPGVYTIRVLGFNVPQGPQPVSIASSHGITFSGSLPVVRVEPVEVVTSDLVASGTASLVRIRTRVFQDTLVAGSVLVQYSPTGEAGPFTPIAMTLQTDGTWTANLPPALCGQTPAYYFQAAGQTVGTVTLPVAGAPDSYGFNVGSWVAFAGEDGENQSGWSYAAPGDSASGPGRWWPADPQAYGAGSPTTIVQPEDDTTPGTGRIAFVTDPRPGRLYDVDNGITTLTSPAFNLSGRNTPARLQMQRWYVNGTPGDATARTDSLLIQFSYDNGATWQTLDDVGANGAVFNGGWQQVSYLLPGTPTAQTRLRFIARDLGVESLVEALIDDIVFSELTCSNPPVTCDSIDFNNDGATFDPQDIEAFLSVYGEGPCVPAAATCNDIDFNNDASLFDPRDIESFLSVYGEGPCL